MSRMAKHLVDIDEAALSAARAELVTHTLNDTVNEALRRVTPSGEVRAARAVDDLAAAELGDREDAWR